MMLTVLTQNLPNHRSLSAEPQVWRTRGDTDAGFEVLGVGRDGEARRGKVGRRPNETRSPG